jgi:hypothetical protein
MTKKTLAVLLPCLILLAFAAFLGAAAPEKPASYSTEVSIQPGPNNTFLLRAKVKDAATGEIVAGPGIKLPAGQAANTETTLEDSSTVVSLSATADGAKHTANYTVTVKRGNKVVSEHSATLSL